MGPSSPGCAHLLVACGHRSCRAALGRLGSMLCRAAHHIPSGWWGAKAWGRRPPGRPVLLPCVWAAFETLLIVVADWWLSMIGKEHNSDHALDQVCAMWPSGPCSCTLECASQRQCHEKGMMREVLVLAMAA